MHCWKVYCLPLTISKWNKHMNKNKLVLVPNTIRSKQYKTKDTFWIQLHLPYLCSRLKIPMKTVIWFLVHFPTGQLTWDPCWASPSPASTSSWTAGRCCQSATTARSPGGVMNCPVHLVWRLKRRMTPWTMSKWSPKFLQGVIKCLNAWGYSREQRTSWKFRRAVQQTSVLLHVLHRILMRSWWFTRPWSRKTLSLSHVPSTAFTM